MGIGRWIRKVIGLRPPEPDLVRWVRQAVDAGAITYSGDDGTSPDAPVVIEGAQWDLAGTAAALEWLCRKYGPMNVRWKMVSHASGQRGERLIDTFHLSLRGGVEKKHYFDLTESFGRYPDSNEPLPDGGRE